MKRRPLLIGALVVLALVAAAIAYALATRPPAPRTTLGLPCWGAGGCTPPQSCRGATDVERGTCVLGASCGLTSPPSSGGPFQLVSRKLDDYAVGLRSCCRGNSPPYWADLVDLRTVGPGDVTRFDILPAKDSLGFFLAASPPPAKGPREYLTRSLVDERLKVEGLDPDPVEDPHKFDPKEQAGALWGLMEGGVLGDALHGTLAGALRCPPEGDRPPACEVPGEPTPPPPLAAAVPYTVDYTTDACANDPAFRWDLRPAPKSFQD